MRVDVMEPRTIMIVGAGIGQLPAILTAKKMGLRVVTVDRSSSAVGMRFADVALPIDIVDIDAVVEAAKSYQISAVMTIQSDLPLPTVGAVVDELGLSGIGYETAIQCSNELAMREVFARERIPSPRALGAKSLQETERAAREIGFPCIVKPADGSGSRGVTKVSDISQLGFAFEQAVLHSGIGQVCVDEFIDGLEIGAQAFSINGRCAMVLVHNDTVSALPYFVPTGHSFPSKLDGSQLSKVEEVVTASVEALDIHTGPSNIDIILTQDGVPMVIEISPRIGATCLPELVHYFAGIGWVQSTIEAALGEEPSLIRTRRTPCAAVIIEAPCDGRLVSYHVPEQLYHIEGVLEIEVEASIGQRVDKLQKGPDRIGKVVVADESWDKAEAKAEWVKSQILINVAEGED